MENIIYSLMRCKGRFSLIVRNRKIFVQENVSFTPIARKSTIGAISYNNEESREEQRMEVKELRDLLKDKDKKLITDAFVEVYKALPKSKKEEFR